MDGQGWLIFLSLSYFIISLAFLTAVGFFVYLLLEIKKTATTFQETLKNIDNSVKNIEENIKPIIDDTGKTLKSIRNISENVETVTCNIKHFSEAMHDIALNLREISGIINNLRGSASLRAAGLKVGAKTALNVLVKELMSK